MWCVVGGLVGLSGCDCAIVVNARVWVMFMQGGEERRIGSESQEGDDLKRMASYTWCAAVAKCTVNHGGVSKKLARDWANLHRALRGSSEAVGALVVNQNKKDLKQRGNRLARLACRAPLTAGATQQE